MTAFPALDQSRTFETIPSVSRRSIGAWQLETMAEVIARQGHNETPWLVDELVHESVSVMASPPKAGKSAFAVGLIAALSKGEEMYLGQTVRRHGSSVIFTTDAGSKREYTKRLAAHGADPSRVAFIDGRRMMDLDSQGWLASVNALTAQLSDLRLVVVDNVLGVLGDAAPGERLNRFYMWLQDFNHAGDAVSVFVLHHTAVADETGYGKGKRPQGGRSNETSARQILTLLPPGYGAPGNVLRLEAYGNDMPAGKSTRYVELRDLAGEPTLVASPYMASREAPQQRTTERINKGARIAELAEQYLAGTPALSRNALAQVIQREHGKSLGLSWTTVRDRLRAMNYPARAVTR